MIRVVSGIVPAMFLIRRLRRWFLRPDFLTFSRNSVTSNALQLKFVYVTSFVLLLDQLRDLPL